jgi:hypothetical protein
MSKRQAIRNGGSDMHRAGNRAVQLPMSKTLSSEWDPGPSALMA